MAKLSIDEERLISLLKPVIITTVTPIVETIVGNAVGGLRAEMNDRFDEVNERFAKVDERFTKIDERFNRIDERFIKINQHLTKVNERFDKQFAKVGERFSEIGYRLDTVEAGLVGVKDVCKNLTTQAALSNRKIEQLTLAQNRLETSTNTTQKLVYDHMVATDIRLRTQGKNS